MPSQSHTQFTALWNNFVHSHPRTCACNTAKLWGLLKLFRQTIYMVSIDGLPLMEQEWGKHVGMLLEFGDIDHEMMAALLSGDSSAMETIDSRFTQA